MALVAVAAVFPLSGVSLEWIAAPAAFVLLSELTPSLIFLEPSRCDATCLGYLRTPDSRGPPASSLV